MAGIALGPHYEEFVRKQLSSGDYADESDVVRAGLRLLEDLEDSRERWLREEIPGRLGEFRASPAIGIPAEEVLEELADWHRDRVAKAGQ